MEEDQKKHNNLNGEMVSQLYEFNHDASVAPISPSPQKNEIIQNMWGITPAALSQITNISRIYASKHGMFASVPIICRGTDCAYKDVCMVQPSERVNGVRCPMEIAAILSRYEQWCRFFNIDTSTDQIQDKDLADATLIRDLVNIEIAMLRAENRIALSGDFMADILLDIDKKCKAYFGKDISPESKYLMDLEDKKIKLLNQLNATRKDKSQDKSRQLNPTQAAVQIYNEVRGMMEKENIVDVTNMQFDDEVKDPVPAEASKKEDESNDQEND